MAKRFVFIASCMIYVALLIFSQVLLSAEGTSWPLYVVMFLFAIAITLTSSRRRRWIGLLAGVISITLLVVDVRHGDTLANRIKAIQSLPTTSR